MNERDDRPLDANPDAGRDGRRGAAGEGFVGESDRTDVRYIHAPIMRELAEPRDGYEPIPLWLVFFFMGLMAWGGWYLGTYNGGWRSDVYDHDPAARLAAAGGEPEQVDPVKLGRRLYTSCRACHQSDGQGLAGNYPPLVGSERVLGPPESLARILLHGLEGPIVVKGESYNNVMPGWGQQYDDEQIAAILTYIRQEWGNSAPAVEPETVARVRERHSGRSAPWSDSELDEAEGGAGR